MNEILQFDLITTSCLFDDDMTSKPHKHTINKELENHLANEDFLFDSTSSLETAIIVDFMSMIRKVLFTKLKTFGESFERGGKWSEIFATLMKFTLYMIVTCKVP